MNKNEKAKAVAKKARTQAEPSLGARIVEGLEEAIAWTKGENDAARVTLVHVPQVDVRAVRLKMGLSQAQFANKFGFPPATLKNWEQGRSRPDTPTQVLLAVIAKHPKVVEGVLNTNETALQRFQKHGRKGWPLIAAGRLTREQANERPR